ncbi:hypothetical protein RF55_914 [Lasius niger]|uniref:Uncharacterized protein n=1 Tax=Lasius niger TaxID=67767 RepID=A0A0J7L8D0_LASNI|nr:hypothetical protein RF55_914 [Lasius niger]
MRKIRLHNPYVIKVRQEALLHLYGLRFQGIVNAEAREEVINNHRVNFTGYKLCLSLQLRVARNKTTVRFQGFCCSCEDAESFCSVAAESSYYQRDDSANRARNRSESSANLFDNAKAQRQVKTSGNEDEERDRQVVELKNGGTRGRVTSHDIFVNGPLGEGTLSKYRDEKQFGNNSIRESVLSSEGSRWMENANRAETLSPLLRSVFSDPSPASKEKIEAYINAVYERAMKEKADRDKNLSVENNFANFNDPKDRFRERSRWLNDGRSPIHGSVVSDPGNSIAKLTKLKGERDFRNSGKDNRKFLELEERDRSANFSESGNRQERTTTDRSRGAARLENTFDCTPTFLAIQSSRIPAESQFSRQTQRNAFSNASPDNGSLATTIQFFTSSGISPQKDTNENINRNIVPSMIKSYGFEGDGFALSSKIVISGTHRSVESGELIRRYGFKTPENISDNVNLRNALAERRNLSAAAFRNGNARSEEMEVENANVSTRISTVPAFTRLRNLSSSSSSSSLSSSSIGISRLQELPALTARPGDKSSTEIHESRTRSSLLATNEVQRFSDEFGNLYEGRTIYSSPDQETPRDVNLKNSYKFWKSPPRWKLRKSKGAEKFQRGDKGGSSKRGFEKSLSSRELIWEKRGSPDFKCDTSRNGSWKRERCFQRRPRRHLRIENEDSNSATSENLPEDEDSRREMRAIVDHYARPKVVYSERKMSETGGNGSPKKQVILESGHSYKKVRSAGGDNPFFFNKENGKESNVDKRIEDKFARISNVLKEDSAVVGIIQQTPENLKAATKSKVADISEIQDELRDDSFSRKDDRSYESVATREATSEYPAELIDTRQRSITNENFLAIVKSTTTNNEITAISSPITLKDDSIYKESASLQSREKLSATVIGPFLSSPITRKLSHNVSKKANSDESTSPIYTNTFTMKRTGSDVFASKLSSETPSETLRRNVDYFAVANESLGTISSNWTNSKETTVYPEAHDNRSESVRDEAENARFLELNKDSSRMIAGNFTEEPRGPAIEADLLLRGSGSITEPRTEASPSDEEGGGEGSYVGDPLRENSVDKFSERSQRSRERDEIAELVDRIVRQYAAYTPLMPDTPTFDEITEAETLPPEDEKTTTTTTVARITTTLATTTRITDATFRPSIRPLLVTTMVLSREMHDEIALDETTFVDETEATTTSLKTTISKREFRRLGRPEGKGRRVSSEIGKGEKRQRTVNRLANMTDAEGEAEDHPWYRTTEVQQIIAANGSKPAQRVEDPRRKNQRYKSKSDYFPNASSTTISSSVADDVTLAQTRNRRSDFIRESSDRDFTIFYDYVEEDNEDRAQNGRRTALSKDGKSPDMTTAPSELRSRIEKGLAGEFNYSANWKSLRRRGCESPERTQKHNAAPRDIATRDVERQANNRDGRYLDSNAREKERNAQDSLRNFALLKLRHVKDGAVDRYDEDVIARSREAISASLEIPFPAKIPTSRKDFSGSVRKRIDRRAAARIDRIASNPLENLRTASANADDLSNRGAESATGRILTGRGKSSGDQDDKGRQTDTVIRGAKLMMADDKGETSRDVFAAAKSADKKIPSSFHGAKQWRRKDAKRKINENPPRVHRAFAYDTVRETIGKIERGRKSSSVPDERNIAGSDESADRSLTDRWRRSGRRLLSSGKSYSYVEDAENEYYEDDGSETDGESDSASDNEAVAGRDDLSDLENQPVLREDRDSRKLLPETDRLADENTDAARTVMPEERTVAARDAAVVPDVQGVSEGAISRNNGKEVMDKNIDLEEKHDIEAELADPASFNDDKKKSFDESENTLRNFRIYEKIDEEPLSFREKISEDDIRDESLYETQPASMIFDTKEITTSRSLSGVGKTHENVDLSQNPITSKGEGSIKISLTGRIQVGGGFNQTPMLISFDAIPDGSSATRSSLSTELSNSIVAVETTAINLPDSNAGSTFDLPSIIEHANDEASDSMNVTADENREEVGRTNTNEVARKSREKFFDLAGGSEGEEDGRRKTAETDSSRIEKRLDKYGANSRTAKQIFLTDCSKSSIASSGEMDRTSVSRTTISERTDEAVDKLDPPASANVVRFPNILGSVLIDKDSREDQNHAKEETSRCRVDVPVGEANRSEIDRSNTTDLHVPLLRVRIEKPRVDSTNDERDGIAPCPGEDSRNVTSGGCYRIPATARKFQLPETTVRELQQTWSNYHDSDSTQQTFPLDIQEATTNDRNAGRFSSSTRSEDDVLDQLTTGYATDETFPTETPCDRCDGESINAIRVRNMMAIVRFMMKLLRIIADEEEPPCLRTRAGETVIRVKNVIVNASSRTGNNVGKQKSATDRTTMMSERERQNFTTTERRSTITERIREKTSPLNGDTFVSEASTLPSSSDEAFKNEVLSTLFQTSTRRKVHASTLSRTTFSATPKSFLFYELERKPAHREDVSSRKNIPQLTDVEQNSSVSFNDSKEDSEAKKSSRLDDGQTNRSRPRNQDRSFADRLRLGKQEIAFATNFKRKKIGPESLREEYSARDKNVGFRTPRSTGVANDTVRSMRDTGVPRDALLEVIDAAIREDGLARTRRKSKAAGISDRRDTRTKLLNSSGGGGGSPGDWIGEHRATATRRLAVDKKLRESREVPGGIAAPEKVVFRRVRGEINPYPRDPNLGGGASDSSVKIEEHVPGNGPLAKLSTDEAPPTVSGDSGSLKRADSTEKARAIRYSSTSSVSDNVGASKIGEEVANEATRSVTITMKLILRESL